jgi:hypoxanthine phosphoribosyltransferase
MRVNMQVLDKLPTFMDKAQCLYDMKAIDQALDRMAIEITEQLSDKNPIVMCVMTGALIVTGHLLTRLNFPLQIDYIHATRYRGATRGGDLHWLVLPHCELKNRTILIIDDIMDGGLTLSAIMDYCQQMGAKSVHTAVMINKKREREPGVNFEPDFIGLHTHDKFLFGFGLDYEGYLRNVAGIYAIDGLD